MIRNIALVNVIIFTWIAMLKASPWLIFLAFPCTLLWILGMVMMKLSNNNTQPQHIAGAFIGLVIVMALTI